MRLILLSITLACGLWAQDPFQVKVTGHGRPVILIPGLSSSGETWDTTVARYKDRFECHVLTLAGYAGVPRIPAPVLATVRDEIAVYIRKNKLDHPTIIGHSLGGTLALDLAAHYPDLLGRIVIVDSYPFLMGAMDPKATLESARTVAGQMRGYMAAQTQEMYEGYVKSGIGTRTMVEKDADFQRITGWGLKSDRTAVTDTMVELFTTDLREDVAKIKAPALVMGGWIGYQGATHEGVEANLKLQYAKLKGVEIQVTDKAHHFIMWDDPEWMFGHLDRFLKTNVK
ncbi:MAG: alpha/beta hydrolase [Candidatus Solibacter sp.]